MSWTLTLKMLFQAFKLFSFLSGFLRIIWCDLGANFPGNSVLWISNCPKCYPLVNKFSHSRSVMSKDSPPGLTCSRFYIFAWFTTPESNDSSFLGLWRTRGHEEKVFQLFKSAVLEQGKIYLQLEQIQPVRNGLRHPWCRMMDYKCLEIA